MPRVIIERAGTQAIPTTSGQPRAGFAPASGQAGVTTAFTNLGKTVAGITQEISAKRAAITEANYVSTMNTETVETIGRLQQEMQTELSDPRGYTEALMEQVDDIYAKALEEAPSDRSRVQLQGIFAGKRNGYFHNAFKFENKAVADTTLIRANENIDTISKEVFQDPNSLAARLQDINLVSDAAGEVLSEGQHEMFKAKAGQQLVNAHLNGLVRAGQHDKALESVSSGQFDQFFTPDQIVRLEAGLQDSVARQQRNLEKAGTQQYKGQLDDLDLSIFQGQTGLSELNEMLDQGMFKTNKDYIDRVKKLNTVNTQAEGAALQVDRIDQALAGLAPLSPSSTADKKAADTYYEQIIAPTLNEEDGLEKAIKFSTDLGVVPKRFKNQLSGNLNSGNTQGQAGAAQVIDGIISREATSSLSFTKRDISRARHITGGMNAGLSAEEAIKAADARIEVDKGIMKRREDRLFDEGIEFSPPTEFFRNDPNEVPDEMALDFDRLLQTFAVELGHSVEDAEELANRRIEGSWHVSKINGSPEYMKFAPEKLFNPKGVNPKWIRKQLVSEMEQAGLGKSFTRIIPDPLRTSEDMEYYVMEEVDGVEVQAIDQNGEPITWFPDYNIFTKGE
jgi:hypothetical protein